MNHPTESYKGYSIQLDYTGYNFRYMFYPTEQGVQHDGDFDGESFKYAGNCKWADSLDEAKDMINEKLAEQIPYHTVEMNGRNYTWKWLSDAVGFASMFNGELSMRFTNP